MEVRPKSHPSSTQVGAATRLAAKRHPTVRQGDQEMLWFEWQDALADRLRLMILPEEYYCPNAPLRVDLRVILVSP